MNKEVLEEYILNNYTISMIAEATSWSKGTVRHYLNKYNLKTNGRSGPRVKPCEEGFYRCGMCKMEKPKVEFYERNRGGLGGYCKLCANTKRHLDSKELGLSRRKQVIDELGGCCNLCGYKKNYAALVFHHIDPAKKDMKLSSREFKGARMDRLLKEASKCMLLCHNCHMELHWPHLKID